jgi:predicted nucleic acid-binding protein
VFADTNYWIALLSDQDTLHRQAVQISVQLRTTRLVTTDAVFTELLNYFAERGQQSREGAATLIREALMDPAVEVLEADRALFLAGLQLFEARKDKGYSLTDCISMHVMRERGITEVLTHDHHFAQEGFTLLL